MSEMKRNEPGMSSARDYLVDIIGLDDAEIEALIEAGESPEFIAESAGILFSDYAKKGVMLEPEDIRKKIHEQYPEAFKFKVVIPTKGTDIGEFNPKFLWKPYIPLHDYTVMFAPGGTGKTFASNWIAAQVSKGGYIRCDTDFYGQEEAKRTGSKPEPGNVLYISAEEDEKLIKDRFIKSGGDPERLNVIDRYKSDGMTFTDGYLQFLLSVKSCNPRLVIIDPVQAFIGQAIDLNRKNQIRPAMQKLAIIAKKCDCAIVLIAHTNKTKDHGENINTAVSGSSDIVDAARSALMVIKDPEDDDARVLIHTKANYTALGDSLKFHITWNGGFVYEGISTVTRETVEAASRNRKTVAEMLSRQKEERIAKEDLIRAIKQIAVPGDSVIVAYAEMKDNFGDDIFGYSKRPSLLIKKILPDLKAYGIGIETETATGTPVSKQYKGGHKNGFEIYQKSISEESE